MTTRHKQKNTLGRLLLTGMLALSASVTICAQGTKMSGQVLDDNGEPVIGAAIQIAGQKGAGTVTDLDGRFSLNVKEGATLRISYVGFKTKDVKATPQMKVTLNENTNTLAEVVAIGYGTVRKKDVTTAVSTVSTEDINSRPIVTAEQAIQGKAAGITVSQPNGAPGAGTTIRVRGTTSLNASNSPLYVVDGVPMTDIQFLSADDIESLQILKDASSAAIYGSRAANGVILITTKQGKNGVAKVALNAHYSFNVVRDNQTPLNAKEYKDLMDEIGLVKLPDNLTDVTDWKDEVYRTGAVQDYQLSITNGNDKLRYFISGGYTGETGVIKASSFRRYNFRAAVENDIKPWLRLNASVAYSDYQWNGTGIISGTGSNRGGVITSIINTPTYAPVWDAENPSRYNTNFYGVNITSPIENIERTKNNKSAHNRIIATGKAIFKILPTLKYTSSLTLDRGQGVITAFLDPDKTLEGRNQFGTASDARDFNSLLIFDNVLNWNQKFGRHGFDGMAGTSWTGSKWSKNEISGSHFATGDFPTLNAANKINQGSYSRRSEWAIMSYFARLQYNYNDTYLLTANLRADGSSKLAPSHRWGYFPSFSGAWRVSEEKFMKDISWINDLKLRGGWGQTGNQSGLGDYAYLAGYGFTKYNWWDSKYTNAVPTPNMTSLANPDLTWERTASTNIGIDLTVLNNRINFTADYYYKKTSDMLMTISLPKGSALANSISFNGGTMVNKGFEFTLDTHNLTGKFQWDSNFNISFNKNELKSLRLTQVYNAVSTNENANEQVVRNEPGRPVGCFYGYISDGVDPETGELMYRDINKDGTVNASDRTYIGDPNPDFTFGFTNNFSYKGINLNILLQGSYGNDIYNASRMDTEGMYDGKNQTTNVLRRWRIPGQITDVPKAGFKQHNSSYYVEDGSYLRVKSVTLSYDVPRRMLKKIGFTRLMPFFTATNLFTITGYNGMDPEINQYGNGAVQGIDWGTYPLNRSFTIGLKAEF